MRVAGSPIQFECVYLNTLCFPGVPPMGTADVVFGRVVAIHIDDEVIDGRGMLDILKIQPLARMGYYDYTFVDHKFEMVIGGATPHCWRVWKARPTRCVRPPGKNSKTPRPARAGRCR